MKHVLLLLANGFEILEASAFIDVIGWNKQEGDGSTTLSSCALTEKVKSSFGQKFIADYNINAIDVNEFDALAIPGGFEPYGFYEDAYSDAFVGIIQQFHKKQKPIASICVGALALGNAGLLINKNATTYPNTKRQTELQNFGALLSNAPVVVDNHMITSKNPSTAVEVALQLLEWLTSVENANKVRQLMGF